MEKNEMTRYEMNYIGTVAKMNDEQKKDFEEAKEWLNKNWRKYTDDDYFEAYAFVEAPDEKREVYRNNSVHIMYADDYTYFEILLNEGEK